MRKIILKTPEFRLAWPRLNSPHTFMAGGSLFYGCSALFATTPTELAEAVQELALSHFGPKVAHRVRTPLAKGKQYGKDGPDYRNFLVANLKSKSKPTLRIFDEDRYGELQLYHAEEEDLYPGIMCFAEVTPYAYDHMGFKGVAFDLLSVTRTREPELTREQASMMALLEATVDPLKDL